MVSDDGGPAYPCHQEFNWLGDPIRQSTVGMSLRDWFAGQALAGLMADNELRPSNPTELEHAAMRLYQFADAMLRIRSRHHGE